jgi:hypothetical protein
MKEKDLGLTTFKFFQFQYNIFIILIYRKKFQQ